MIPIRRCSSSTTGSVSRLYFVAEPDGGNASMLRLLAGAVHVKESHWSNGLEYSHPMRQHANRSCTHGKNDGDAITC